MKLSNAHRSLSWTFILSISIALTVFVYLFGMPGEYVYDDFDQLTRSGLRNIFDFKNVVFNGLRQIRLWQNITFAMNWTMTPGDLTSFKFFNLLLHLINGVLLLRWLKIVFPKPKESIAYLATLIFLLHPLQIQSVTYVMGRISLLQAFFYLLAINVFASWSTSKMKILYVIAFLSLFAKETCVFIPALLLFYEITIHKKEIKDIQWSKWVPFLLLPLLWIPIHSFLKDPSSLYANTSGFHLYPFFRYSCAQAYYFLFYLYLFIIPNKQSIIHSFPEESGYYSLIVLMGAVAYVGLLLYMFYGVRKHPLKTFFLGFFFLIYLPTSSIFQMINPFAEYRLYQTNIVLSVFFAFLLFSLSELYFKNKDMFIKSVAIFLILGMSYLTFKQCAIWRSAVAVYKQGLAIYPSEHTLLNNLSAEYFRLRKYAEAEKTILEARKYSNYLESSVSQNMYMLALAYYRENNFHKTLELLKKLDSDPARPAQFPQPFYELKKAALEAVGAKIIK